MTTARSPLRALKAQSDKMAAVLKAAARGEVIPNPGGKQVHFTNDRTTGSIKFGVVMDDKVLTIEMTWATIREHSEAGISEYILKQMRESRETTQ